MSLLDLAYEIGLSPNKVSNTLGGEYHSKCPSCDGHDRFIINPNRPMKNCYGSYWCRKCGIHGDSIQFCKDYLRLDFTASLDRVNATIVKRSFTPRVSYSVFTPAQLIKPPDKWIFQANLFTETSHKEIFKHQDILRWLENRGINNDAVIKYKLGWNNKDKYYIRNDWGLDKKFNQQGKEIQIYLPSGIVIPMIDQSCGMVYRVKIRRENWTHDDKLPRYMAISGSMNGLNLFGDKSKNILICVESELDAICLESMIGETALVVAVGGNIKNPDNLTDFLAKNMKLIFICHDNDDGGLNMLKSGSAFIPMQSHYQLLLEKILVRRSSKPSMLRRGFHQ